jgi:hypothetical protein
MANGYQKKPTFGFNRPFWMLKIFGMSMLLASIELGLQDPAVTFDDVVNVSANISKQRSRFHPVTKRNKRQLAIDCCHRKKEGDDEDDVKCPYKIRATVGLDGCVQINQLNTNYSCELNNDNRRGRQYKSSVLASVVPSLASALDTDDVTCLQVSQIGEQKAWGIKTTQVHNMVSNGKGVAMQLAQFKLLRSAVEALQEQDPGGRYVLCTERWQGQPLPNFDAFSSEQFQFLYVCPSASKAVADSFSGIYCADAAHLTNGTTNGYLFTYSTFDANSCLTPMAFGVTTGETEEAWHLFLSYATQDLQTELLFTDEGAALCSGTVERYLTEHNVLHALCARHVIENAKGVSQEIR